MADAIPAEVTKESPANGSIQPPPIAKTKENKHEKQPEEEPIDKPAKPDKQDKDSEEENSESTKPLWERKSTDFWQNRY